MAVFYSVICAFFCYGLQKKRTIYNPGSIPSSPFSSGVSSEDVLGVSLDVALEVSLDVELDVSLDVALEVSLETLLDVALEVPLETLLETLLEVVELVGVLLVGTAELVKETALSMEVVALEVSLLVALTSLEIIEVSLPLDVGVPDAESPPHFDSSRMIISTKITSIPPPIIII